MSARTPSKNRARWLLPSVLILFIICALILGVGYLLARPAQETPLALITAPQHGETFIGFEGISVTASGLYSTGVERLELYVDGGLASVQETTLPGGSNPLMLLDEWTPSTPGRHLLTVRAYTKDGQTADSSVVMVDVLPAPETLELDLSTLRDPASGSCPSLSQISSTSGVLIERLIELNPTLVGTDPNAPLACDVRLTAPSASSTDSGPGGSGTSPGGGGPTPGGSGTGPGGGSTGSPPPASRVGSPAAPTGLIGTLTCTDATISWNASPDAADGYALYVLRPGSSRFERLVFMSGETSTSFPISTPGDYRFQIASLRGGMEGLSPLVTLSMPGLCVPPAIAPGVTDLTLSLMSMVTSEPFDGAYCYARVMEMPDVRLPRLDFSAMRPGADGVTYSIQHQLPNRGMFRIAIPEDGAVTLGMECWGYRGAESHSLGSFTSTHFREEWDGRELSAIHRSGIKMASLNGIPPQSDNKAEFSFRMTYRIAASIPSALPGLLDPGLLPSLTPDMLTPIEGPGMNIPAPTNLRIRNIPGRLGLNVWSGELEWDWNGAPHFNESTISGYHVTMWVQDVATGRLGGSPVVFWQADVTPGSRKYVTLPRIPEIFGCGYSIIFRVSARAGTAESPTDTNRDLYLRQPECRAAAQLNITLVSLQLQGVLDHGEYCPFCGDNLQIELKGSISTIMGVRQEGIQVLRSLNPRDACDGFPIGDGIHPFYDLYLLRFRNGRGESFGRLQHQLRLNITDSGQTIPIYVRLFDHDPLFLLPCGVRNDRVLRFDLELPARSVVDWQRYQETIIRSGRIMSGAADGSVDQGQAAITIHIIGEPWRP